MSPSQASIFFLFFLFLSFFIFVKTFDCAKIYNESIICHKKPTTKYCSLLFEIGTLNNVG